MKDDKKWTAKDDKRVKPEVNNDQLGENASEEWKSEAYDNQPKGKGFTDRSR